jgi:hypothetical protein
LRLTGLEGGGVRSCREVAIETQRLGDGAVSSVERVPLRLTGRKVKL